MNQWEEEYLKKADYARSLEQTVDQLQRRLDTWEVIKAKRDPIHFDPIGPRSSGAVREARVQDLQYNLSICDEQVALMRNSMEVVCEEGIDALVREFKKTIRYQADRDEKNRVSTVELSVIMERK